MELKNGYICKNVMGYAKVHIYFKDKGSRYK